MKTVLKRIIMLPTPIMIAIAQAYFLRPPHVLVAEHFQKGVVTGAIPYYIYLIQQKAPV